MTENDPLSALSALPDAPRLRSAKLKGTIAALVLDASGLSPDERNALEARMRDAALAIAGVEHARIVLTTSRPDRKIVAIGSGKGGVGKSTVAANLAVALARMGKRVGMIDADIYGPSQPTLLAAHDRPVAEAKTLLPVVAPSGVRLLSVGQLVPAGQALAWRGPMASGALAQLIEGHWGDTEILLVDLPPGTGDVQLSMIQKHKPAGAVIVSTPQDLALIDATRAVSLFEQAGVPMVGLVENMAGYACPHCGEVSDPFGQGGAEAAARQMGMDFLGRIPLTISIRTASDAGQPPAAGEDTDAAAFKAVAEKVAAWLDQPRAG